MSSAARQRGAGALFPPIEVGSFVSLRSDRSEFTGSASGIFFINTVFRAFAASSAYDDLTGTVVNNTNPAPGSIHSFLGTAEAGSEQTTDGDVLLGLISSSNEEGSDSVPSHAYGINIPGLGGPPSPTTAKKLLMNYFKKWHPFFPFLHGPSFFEQVNQFYEAKTSDERAKNNNLSLRDKLCRAVCFQCVFNIAAVNGDSQAQLEPRSRITSPAVLSSLAGILANGQDIAALQALLAVELFLVTRMSLRAASTVHGTLTRGLYQAGLHRCPFRYVQLPSEKRAIRQRIWWCTYVLDRHISLSLGHPTAISDDEVDVCIPGMPELHNPVHNSYQGSIATAGDEVRAHLPRNHASFGQDTDGGVRGQTDRLSSDCLEAQSPAQHHKSHPEDARNLVLGYMVTYSQLVGKALSLFHTSIHKRSIALDNILDITSRIHSWWNSLPSSLQDEQNGKHSPYGASFAILYHYLILFVNRPFLSLPTNREDFRSSLQAALSASRAILRHVQTSHTDAMVLAWPAPLSAVWMSGLVVAYACLLKVYPLEKGKTDLNQSLVLLESMASTWASALHCHNTLKLMLDQLTSKAADLPMDSYRISFPMSESTSTNERLNNETIAGATDEPRNKRRKYNNHLAPQTPPRSSTTPAANAETNTLYPEIWQPILEYNGPDFGFDAYQFGRQDAWQDFLTQGLNPGLSGLLFDNDGWDSYVQTFGDRLNY